MTCFLHCAGCLGFRWWVGEWVGVHRVLLLVQICVLLLGVNDFGI